MSNNGEHTHGKKTTHGKNEKQLQCVLFALCGHIKPGANVSMMFHATAQRTVQTHQEH